MLRSISYQHQIDVDLEDLASDSILTTTAVIANRPVTASTTISAGTGITSNCGACRAVFNSTAVGLLRCKP